MIEKGKLTLIDGNTYMVMKIEDGMAHLKDMVNPKGRPRKMSIERVPYFNEEGEFIVPEVKSLPKFNVSGKISLRAMVKEYTDMSVSRDFIGFLKLWIEGAIEDLVIGAEENAKGKNHSSLTAGHLYWWEMHPSQSTNGYWPSQIQHMRELNDE
tara:strand:+ start:1281 stop:1742 length:462 start_codon:yes stop_codon:yes gene_type:complete